MSSQIAKLVFFAGIFGLFWLDRRRGPRASGALWVPIVWLFINGSRPLSMWLSIFGLGNSGPISSAETYLEGSPIDGPVFTFLLISGVVILATRIQKVLPYLRSNAAIVLYFMYCAVSFVWSDYPWVTFKHWSKGIGDIVMVLVILTDSEPFAAIKHVFARLSFLLIPLSVLFVKYIPALGRGYTISGGAMYTGVTPQKNSLGIICLIFGLSSIWRYLDIRKDNEDPYRRRRLLAYAIIICMAIWLLWMCNSVTSITCLVMGGFVMVLARRPFASRHRWIVHAAVFAILSTSLFAIFFDSRGGMLQAVGRNPTLTGRTEIWREVISLSENQLLGTGYESFWLGDRLVRLWTDQEGLFRGINEAHNGYIEVFINIGWIGVTLLGILIFAGYRNIIAKLPSNVSGASFALAVFVAQLVYNFSEAGFRMMNPLWIVFLLALLGIPKADDSLSFNKTALENKEGRDLRITGKNNRHKSTAPFPEFCP